MQSKRWLEAFMAANRWLEVAAGLLTVCFCSPETLAETARPNVLFIAVDDLRPELGAYGANTVTPNLDQLAATGMRFDRAYCQQAVCGASRLSIMTSLYPTYTGEQTFHVTNWRDRHPEVVTLNQHLRGHGYHTVGLGKIYHQRRGKEVDLANWDEWIDVWAPDYALAENRDILEKALAESKGHDSRNPPKGPTAESAEVPDDGYCDGIRAQRAAELLRDLANQPETPFFFAVGFVKPHLPFNAPAKYWRLYERDAFQMPPNAAIPPGYPAGAANLDAGEMKQYSDYEGTKPTDFSDALNRRLLHGYAAATSYVDACVGQVLDSLQAAGLADNTIVVLWGDHGWKLGDHSSWCKHTNFECDTRVPLIVRDPRTQSTGSTSQVVELIDLYPTLCELTGVPTPVHCQGRSFRQLLSDPTDAHRQDAYSSYPYGDESIGHSIRFGRYRYTEWWKKESQEVEARVLTDLQADPGEVTNVANDPEHADALDRGVERLRVRVRAALREKVRDPQPTTTRGG
ncbi:MAG: sulfatase [Planctomycetota bacterium]